MQLMEAGIPRSLLLPAMFLALLPAAMAVAEEPQPQAVSPDLIHSASEEWKARNEARRACARQAVELGRHILDGTVTPEQTASNFVAMGCFGLLTTVSGIPSGISYAPGVECRPNDRLFVPGRLQLLFFSPGTDVVSFDRVANVRIGQEIAAFYAFARDYNTAILAQPGFPYGDLCRPAPDYRPSGLAERLSIAEWGFRPLEETDTPGDIYQAARRGTLQSLRKLIEEHPIDVHVPDVLGLTPLAWAVIYNRPDHMRLLLAAGAHPYGAPYQAGSSETSPFMIARTEHNSELTAIMRPAVEARGLPLPALPAMMDEMRSHPVDTGFKTFELDVSSAGRVTDCHLIVGDARFVYPVICDRIKEAVFYFPAENGKGDHVATTVTYTSVFLAAQPERNK